MKDADAEAQFALLGAGGSKAESLLCKNTCLKVAGHAITHWPVTQWWFSVDPEARVVAVGGFGRQEDFDKVDVEDKVAVVHRGAISFRLKKEAAKQGRASGLIIVNETSEEPKLHEIYVEDCIYDPFPIVVIMPEDAEQLGEKLVTMTPSAFHAAITKRVYSFRQVSRRWLGKCIRAGMCGNACGLLAAAFSFFGLSSYILPLLLVMGAGGTYVQFRLVMEVKKWISGEDLPFLKKAMESMQDTATSCGLSLCCIPVWLYVFLETFPEWVDPVLDGSQVGRAYVAIDDELDDAFKASWNAVCTAEGFFWMLCPGYWGIARSLTFVYLCAMVIPVWAWNCACAIGSEDEGDDIFKTAADLDADMLEKKLGNDMASRCNILQAAANANNLPVVAEIFGRFAEAQQAAVGSLKSTSVFMVRVMFEAVPMLWLQISLLGLTWYKSTNVDILIALFSIASSCKTVLTNTISMLCELKDANIAMQNGADHVTSIKVVLGPGIPMLLKMLVLVLGLAGILSLAALAACILRVAGIFYCEDNVLNLSQMSMHDPSAGCWVWRSRSNQTAD